MPLLRLTARRNQRDFPWPGMLLADVGEASLAQLCDAVRAAPESEPIYLAGGEPTLRRDLFALIEQLAAAFPTRELVLLTNGRFFFYDRSCAALAATGVARLATEVWIAATRREVHEAMVAVPESLDQADRGIHNLLARGLRTRVRLLVGRQNCAELHDAAANLCDRYRDAEQLVWDVATLAGDPEWRAPLDELASYLESALTLQRSRGVRAVVDGMPACLLRAEHRAQLGGGLRGVYRDACAECGARATCPGLPAAVRDDPTLPIAPVTPAGDGAAYEAYLRAFLAQYVPAALHDAGAVLDAMCGQDMPNLAILRRVFAAAAVVHGTDVDLDPRTVAPSGTALRRADLVESFDGAERYDLIAVFKPPGDAGFPLARALANLFGALRPSGWLLLVLAEHTEVAHVTAVLDAIGAEVLVAERNRLWSLVEPEHKWVCVCRPAPRRSLAHEREA